MFYYSEPRAQVQRPSFCTMNTSLWRARKATVATWKRLQIHSEMLKIAIIPETTKIRIQRYGENLFVWDIDHWISNLGLSEKWNMIHPLTLCLMFILLLILHSSTAALPQSWLWRAIAIPWVCWHVRSCSLVDERSTHLHTSNTHRQPSLIRMNAMHKISSYLRII